MAEITKEDVVQFIENMSVLDLSNLIKDLEEKFGVSAAAMAAPVAAAAGGGDAAAAEEKTEFDVVLQSAGEKESMLSRLYVRLQDWVLKKQRILLIHCLSL